MELRNFVNRHIRRLVIGMALSPLVVSQSFANEALNQITFADSRLENCVNAVAAQNGWTHTNQFTTLDCADKQIANLSGLEGFTELSQLNLSINQIRNIDALSQMQKLTVLYLGGNQLSDISAVANMSGLTELSVRTNNLTSIEPVKNLSQIQKLYIRDNQIVDISPLADLSELTHLWAQVNQIYDISAIENNAKLVYADLRFNQLSDVSAFSQLTALQSVDFSDNNNIYCADLNAIASQLPTAVLTRPEQCASATIQSVTFMDAELKACVLQNAQTNGWQQASQVTELQCAERSITNAFGVNRFANLSTLNLSLNQITDVSPMAKLNELEVLFLGDNQIANMDSLQGLVKLKELSVRSNALTDVTAVSDMTALEKLYIWQNQIADITPLADLDRLTHLWAANNQITDISSLLGLTNLSYANLVSNNGISCSSLDELEQRLGSNLERPTSCGALPLSQVQFADSALTTCVATAAQQNGWLQVNEVVELDCPQSNIASIEGIEHLTNLSFLNLSLNKISDISALASLNQLTTLYLGDNLIEDISPLANLTGLQALSLRTNKIVDISALANLTALTKLYIWKNQISDLSALANLTALTHLWASDNAIADISPLASLTRLVYLDLRLNQISDISPLAGLTQLNELALADNQISDLSALVNLTQLSILNLQNNQISDISQLQGLTALNDVQLQGNDTIECEALDDLSGSLTAGAVKRPEDCISNYIVDVNFADDRLRSCVVDMAQATGLTNINEVTVVNCAGLNINQLGGIEQFVNLKEINLSRNQVTNITPLAGLTSVETLYLGDNRINNLSALSNLTAVSNLSIRSNNIVDLTPIANLNKIEKLYIWDNNITNLTAIASFSALTHLWSSSNQISDLSPLAGLSALQYVWLASNGITDLSALSSLNLLELHVNDNQIINIDGLASQTQLTQLQLENNQIQAVAALNNLTNLQNVNLSGNNNISCAELALLERNLGQNTVTRPQSCAAFTNTIAKQYFVVDGKSLNAYIANHFTKSGETLLLSEPESGQYSFENGILKYESAGIGTDTVEWAKVANNQVVEVLQINIEIGTQNIVDGYPSKNNNGQLAYGYSAYPGETISFHINGATSGATKLSITSTAGEVFDTVQANLTSQSISNAEPWINGFGYNKTFDYTIDANMKSGLYFIDGEGGLFFVVKDPNPSDVIAVIPTNTINAYSCAGGRSMYSCWFDGTDQPQVPKVSFLRPIRDTSRDYADTLGHVLPAVQWLEDEQTQHANVSFITDLELDELGYYQNSSLLMILGHNEYWTHIAQDNFDNYTQVMGKNAWIGGGNVMWWASRYEDNDNTLVTFKYSDPEAPSPEERTILFLSLGVQLVNSMGGSFDFGGYDINRMEGERETNPFRITQPNSPLFAGTNMSVCQQLDMGKNIEFDGPPLAGFDANGLPVGDTQSMDVYRHEILAYGWGSRGGHTMGTMHVHQNVPESGYVVQFGSIGATWQVFNKSDGQLYRKIMNNTLDILTTGKNPFSPHADEVREVVYPFVIPMSLDATPNIFEKCAR